VRYVCRDVELLKHGVYASDTLLTGRACLRGRVYRR
jgi:hypothetical protein